MAILHLNVKSVYFNQIKSGVKNEEYRLCTAYWKKRLIGRQYDGILVKRGYPKIDDLDNQEFRKWNGFQIKTIVHEHFGSEPVEVFAICLANASNLKG